MNTFEKCCIIRKMLLTRAAETMLYDDWSDEFATKNIREYPNDLKKIKNGADLLGIQPAEMSAIQMKALGFGTYSKDNPMKLIPLWLFPFLADKIETESITGEKCTKKADMDTDNRFGYLAYGIIPLR